MLFVTLRFPTSVELAENELVIHRLAGKRRIPKNLLERMSIGEIARVNTVAMQGVTLWVRDPRKNKTTIVQFNNIKEGSAALYASLMDWSGFVSVDSPQL